MTETEDEVIALLRSLDAKEVREAFRKRGTELMREIRNEALEEAAKHLANVASMHREDAGLYDTGGGETPQLAMADTLDAAAGMIRALKEQP